jgi:hypothetical protein
MAAKARGQAAVGIGRREAWLAIYQTMRNRKNHKIVWW